MRFKDLKNVQRGSKKVITQLYSGKGISGKLENNKDVKI